MVEHFHWQFVLFGDVCTVVRNENAFGLNIYGQMSVFVCAGLVPNGQSLPVSPKWVVWRYRGRFHSQLDICEVCAAFTQRAVKWQHH